jgi:protein-disulfide isomerase
MSDTPVNTRRRLVLWSLGTVGLAAAGAGSGVALRRWTRSPPLTLDYGSGVPVGPAPEPGRRYEISLAGAPSVGPPDARITIVQFSDLECPFSAAMNRTLEQRRREWGGSLRLVWKDFPLPTHRNAIAAALLARAAAEQGLFWPMARRLLANQDRLTRADLQQHAEQLGLGKRLVAQALARKDLRQMVQADVTLAIALGLRGAPSVFVNGRFVRGLPSAQKLQRLAAEPI